MKKYRAWVYECEYCGKKNRSSGHMKKHELHCTRNPNRECGFCKEHQFKPKPLSILIKFVKQNKEQHSVGDDNYFNDFLSKENLEKLRIMANDCPACILSALVQGGVNYCDYFDFNEEKRGYLEAG